MIWPPSICENRHTVFTKVVDNDYFWAPIALKIPIFGKNSKIGSDKVVCIPKTYICAQLQGNWRNWQSVVTFWNFWKTAKISLFYPFLPIFGQFLRVPPNFERSPKLTRVDSGAAWAHFRINITCSFIYKKEQRIWRHDFWPPPTPLTKRLISWSDRK